MSIEGQGHFLTLAQGHLHMKIKTGFSKKPLWQILYVSFQVQGNEKSLTRCWSHDKDGPHAHAHVKTFQKISPETVDRFP